MAENDKPTSAKGSGKAQAEPIVHAEAAHTVHGSARHEPVLVLEKNKKKKRKRKYSRGLKGVQRLQRGVARASWRIGDAVADGLKEFRKRNDRSGRKRRDGALRDTFKNVGRATGEFLKGSGKAPYALVRRLPTKAIWRQARPVAQFLAWPFPR
jgi:hypothetical protein